jgi:hypothetical protein
MRIVYVQANELGLPINEACFVAYEGFRLRGQEIRLFNLELGGSVEIGLADIVSSSQTGEVILVADIPTFTQVLEALGIEAPPVIDYPLCLRKFLGRELWETTLGEVRDSDSRWPLFIKPSQHNKHFSGHLIRRFGDLIDTNTIEDSFPIWASQPVRFEAEWRVFVLDGKVLDARIYRGSRWVAPIESQVLDMVKCFEESGTAPAAYALDVGLVLPEAGEPRMLLVEVNDGRALGTYGLEATFYAQMLEARWRQIVSKP